MSERTEVSGVKAESGLEASQGTIQEQIRGLVKGQPFCVLCTQGDGQPYGSVVALAYNDECASLAFATPEGTFKYRLLCECDRVALVVDTRSQYPDDVMRAAAVTATGRAVRLQPGTDLDWWQARLAERHPQLAAFFIARDTALFRVDIERYKLVTRFQEVHVWEPQSE
jgi:nitroimidazol reductase NimA-like FMN-containing flavoprotein (pyridoxamine 5'-phosphate oxidase superfamily)